MRCSFLSSLSCRPSLGTQTRRVLLAVAVLTAVVPATADASSSSSKPSSQSSKLRQLQQQRDHVRTQKARKATEVDALTATDAQVKQALSDLDANISGATSRLEDARRAAAAAAADEADARTRETTAAAELASLRSTIKSQAVEAYTNSPPDQSFTVLSASDANEAASRNTLVAIQASRNLDVVEHFRSVQQDLSIARQAAIDANRRAELHRGEADHELRQLQAAQDEQERFAARVESRIEDSLAEADSLADLDGALAGQITQTQASIARELEAQRVARQRRDAKLGLKSRGSSARSSSGSGSDTAVPTFGSAGGNGIVSVGGIRVDSSIAGALQALLNAASADGVQLGGGGFRDPASQISLRRSHCGSSNYAIYEAPASSCSPPTARPGRSMHERGLAIDFTQNGRALSRSTSGYAWLNAHAASYGFYNLPSEAWHWSTNGN